MSGPSAAGRRRQFLFGALAVVLAGCTGMPTVAAPPPRTPLQPNLARVWFYRDYMPYESLSRPYIRMNDHIIGISEPGGAFYRDVPPGQYTITVDSWGTDVNQFPIVTLKPGEVLYAKVESLSSWSNSGGRNPYQRDTFYVRLLPPQIAQAELPSHEYVSGQ